MADPIVITRHGTTAPIPANLADFQLGYDSAANNLYIRNGAAVTLAGQNQELKTSSNVNFGTIGSGPVTILAGTAAAGTAPLKFTEGTDLATPEAGAVEYDGKSFSVTATDQRRNLTRASDPVVATDIANTIANTVLWTGTLNAGAMYVGKVITVRSYGIINNQAAAGVVTFVIKLNGTTIGTIASPGAKLSDDPFDMQATFTVRTVHATGKVSSHLHLTIKDADNHTVTEEITLNTTAAVSVTINATWSAEHAENYAKLTQGWLTIEH